MRAAAKDMVVVGGGPAGLAVAIRARAAGMSVVVLDPRHPPIDQPCGEGLMPEGADLLAEMGVFPATTRSFRGIRYLDGDLHAEGRFHERHGLGIRRTELHQALVDRAAQLGADLRWGVAATGLDEDAVLTDKGQLHACWIIGADGRHSRLRRWAGLAPSPPSNARYGIRRHYQVAPWSDLVEVYWQDRCEAYVTPLGGDQVCVALIWSGRASGFDELVAHHPRLRERLADARVMSRDAGAGPFGARARKVGHGRVLLCGDAAQSLDPITGEGVTLALHAASEIVGAVVLGDPTSWARAQRRLRRAPARLSRLVLLLERRPRLRRRVIETLSANPTLFDRFLACRHGSGTAVVGAVQRLLLGMMRPRLGNLG